MEFRGIYPRVLVDEIYERDEMYKHANRIVMEGVSNSVR